jgi:pimeloyl-ACP methyl ester carboxylesterase
MGGQIAMELVHTYPERVAALVLADTSPAAETAEGKANRRRIADDITANGMADYARDLLPGMLAASTITQRPDLARYVLEMMTAAPARGAAAALRGRAERRDYGATLLTLELPTLVVVGSEDAFTPVDEAESTVKMLRNGRLVVLDGTGHMPNLEATDAFNAALEHWLRSTGIR